jgi:hypothetical protein
MLLILAMLTAATPDYPQQLGPEAWNGLDAAFRKWVPTLQFP